VKSLGPYKYDIKYKSEGFGGNYKGFYYKVNIYYNNRLVNTKWYDNSYSQSEVEQDIINQITIIGIDDIPNGRPLPPYDPQTAGDEEIDPNESGSINLAESIDLSKILSILGIDLPISNLPVPPPGSLSPSGSGESPTSITGSLSSISGSLPTPPPLPKKLNLVPISGKIVDLNTNEPLIGVKVISPLKKITKTDKNGDFEVKVPKIVNTPLDPKKFTISISKNKYAPTTIIPYTSNLDTKTNLGIVTLKPLESNLKREIADFLTFKEAEVKEYTEKNVTVEFKTQKKLNESINNLKKLVIPLLLGLIAQYGVTKVQELIDEIELNGGQLPDKIKELITCPPPEVISKIIERKNKLVKQLTNVLNSINKATEVLTISQKYISIADISLKILENIPTPTAIGGVGIPISVINGIQKTINFLSQLIGKLNIANGFILSILLLLRATLTQVLNILKLLDLITQYCSGATPTPISAELTALTIQQSNQLSPVVTNVNGFEMGVETESTTKTLKRRRAIARNKQGVVMLQGEWSYSSIDQILIDELVFYIQQNNLKAD
jgi:hypothetical protein